MGSYWGMGGFMQMVFNFFTSPWREESEGKLFAKEFKETFGQTILEFEEGNLVAAQEKAKSLGRLLLVYLHSPEHEDTPLFCDVLREEEVSLFINENFIFWGGDISRQEASSLCERYNVATFPCLLVVTGEGRPISKIEGKRTVGELIADLSNAVEEYGAIATAERLDREEVLSRSREMDEQNSLYQESLIMDQTRERERERERKEKEQKEREEQLQKEMEELERKRKEEQLKRRKEEAQNRIPPEPDRTVESAAVRVRLPGGNMLQRKFAATDLVQSIYDYVLVNGELDIEFELVTNFPSTVVKPDSTVKDAGLCPQALLMVREVLKE